MVTVMTGSYHYNSKPNGDGDAGSYHYNSKPNGDGDDGVISL